MSFTAFKVMRLEGGLLISGANSRLSFPASKGATIEMPPPGIFASPNRQYVLDYYSGLAEHEVLLTLECNHSDITSGNLDDREAEVSISSAVIACIDPIEV